MRTLFFGSVCQSFNPQRLLLIWTVSLLPAMWSTAVGQESPASPAPWMQGVSTWNAGGDDGVGMPDGMPDGMLESDYPTASVPTSAGTTPYTVPIDPAVYTNSLDQPAAVTTDSYPVAPATWAPPVPVTGTPPAINGPGAALPATESSATDVSVASYQDDASDSSGVEPVNHTLTQRLDSGISMMQPPLQEAARSWYQYPWTWMTQGWTNSIELGIDGSTGNARTLAIQTGADLKRKTDVYTLGLDVDYRLVTNRSITTEDNGRLNIDYDRLFGEGSPWSLFSKFGLEWDEFKAFDLRLNLNGGVGYHWIRNDATTFVTRFGAGASKEIGAPDDGWTPEAVFGAEGEHQLNKYNKFKAKVDYFPAWEDFSDYRIVSDFAWEILLDDSDNLSLKLALTDRYDSTPQGAEPNDFYYSLLLLMKF